MESESSTTPVTVLVFVDDMVFIHEDQHILLEAIENFLEMVANMPLQLNHEKSTNIVLNLPDHLMVSLCMSKQHVQVLVTLFGHLVCFHKHV